MDISNKKMKHIENISSNSYSKLNEQLDQLDSIYGKRLLSPIFGNRYQLPDVSNNRASLITLDTSFLHVRLIKDSYRKKNLKSQSGIFYYQHFLSTDSCLYSFKNVRFKACAPAKNIFNIINVAFTAFVSIFHASVSFNIIILFYISGKILQSIHCQKDIL